MMFEDQRLLNRLHAGDKDALRLIYEKYIDGLLRVAMSLLSDIQSAEDCLHDVFVDFAATANRSMIRRNLRSYLVSCVANRARDQLRRQTRESMSQKDRVCNPSIPAEPLRRLVEAEESVRILGALAKLPYQHREVFVLRAQGEMRFREIADLLDLSVNSVQSRYRYAIAKLRLILNEES
ncbi:MAG: RNA polymerase sigma factor [Planctomycetota bacterium]|jgi:RNA polymerase sigma-70 factor (ECF subfamily)